VLERLNPAVPRRHLALIAGAMWGAVGVMLLIRAGFWLGGLAPARALPLGLAGLALGLLLLRTSFRRLVRRNLDRLDDRPERACLFSAFPWRSWLMALLMSLMGVTLRRNVPSVWLVAPYLAMGVCLGWGGGAYLAAWRRR